MKVIFFLLLMNLYINVPFPIIFASFNWFLQFAWFLQIVFLKRKDWKLLVPFILTLGHGSFQNILKEGHYFERGSLVAIASEQKSNVLTSYVCLFAFCFPSEVLRRSKNIATNSSSGKVPVILWLFIFQKTLIFLKIFQSEFKFYSCSFSSVARTN